MKRIIHKRKLNSTLKKITRSKISLKLFCLPLLLAALFVGELDAQDIQSDISGFYATVNLQYGQWSTSSDFLRGIRDIDPNSIGLQLSGGYGFNQKAEVFLQLSYSDFNMSRDWNTYAYTQFGAGFRYNLGATLSKFRPFLDVQLNAANMNIDRIFIQNNVTGFRVEGELDMSGISLSGGGGVRYFIKPWLAATVHARFQYGSDFDVDLDGVALQLDQDQDVSVFDVGIGVAWYFGKKF